MEVRDDSDGETELADDTVTTVSELNDAVAERIESATDLHSEFIVGEVADSGASNGTLYFQLTDDEASIQCLVFNRYRGRLDIDIEDGLEIAVMGELSYYEEKGRCSIIIHDAITIGEGAYKQKLKKRREELSEEGVFDEARKQSLPEVPETVGLVTAVGSDAQEDTINTIHERYPDVDVLLHGATVQGDRASGDLPVAIQTLDVVPAVDVLIVTRGGGSEEDLRAFNEEPVVRAVAETTTPVIVGIGHEQDHVLAGEAADSRAITPTNAGEQAVPKKIDYLDEVATYREEVEASWTRTVEQQLTTYRERVTNAFEAVETEHEHAQEVAATRRRYQIVIALVVLLLLIVVIWVML